jgi:hypothetical protein
LNEPPVCGLSILVEVTACLLGGKQTGLKVTKTQIQLSGAISDMTMSSANYLSDMYEFNN